ncbi:NACHT, LRR and PYD domains-containing protein 1b allele 3 isoform X3 [Carassius auratus]|uniref:NACHT, LRR and PYD domains-containing protein 1b allele 3 isoform X3 n=1 Tax=Carassius auratus TaxID=7957 RepID=A0A6P6PSE5_CARAU|nr:NACHT, LRR and PYD domains-containing protein 1b allele 3-like isoform X3 [Carassius auratus]
MEVRTIILDILEDLTHHEFMEFRWHLTDGRKGKTKFPRSILDHGHDLHETVERMISYLNPDGAGKITVDILKMMSRDDLAWQLQMNLDHYMRSDPNYKLYKSKHTSESDTAQSQERCKPAVLRQCKTCADARECDEQDSDEWELIEPSVISEDAQTKYSTTGLRIECSREVQLKYHICDWECVADFPGMEHFTPCGPLMDIAVISGKLKAVYLPHFLCLGGSPINDEVRVVHVEESGISFEKCTLTRFHAKLLNHYFSPKGVLLRIGFPVNYHCETLIYETQKSYLTLHVYLIPSEKKLIEAAENNEIKSKSKLISKPGPVSSLKTKTWYSLMTLDENKQSACNSEVQPKQLELKYKHINPDFYEVFVADPNDFHLQLMPQHHSEGVWEAKIRQGDYSQRVSSAEAEAEQKQEGCINYNGAEFVEKHRTELISRVSLVEPIADDMRDLIKEEKYTIVLNSGTRQSQMRALLDFLTTPKLKEKLYQSLLEHEHALVNDLENPE